MADYTATVECEIDGRVGILRLNRPRQHNAINQQMMTEATEALRRFNEDERIHSILVTGSGASFCAGFDLKEIAAKGYTTMSQWRDAITADFEFVMQFWTSVKPTVAAVHGYCLGSGLELAVACDVTVADEKATFGEPEVKFGSSIVALILPWIVGPKYAKEWLLTGNDRMPASRAAEIGLVNRVVSEGTVEARALELAHEIAAASPMSVQMTKRAINRTADIQGMREALLSAVDTSILIESNLSPETAEFNRIANRDGMKAAVAWRDGRH
ncbi:enoyl-CoA hydratase/isomerase family protein [Burkholderia cepacia]|uniref:Enoyl-CoA hydratase/isomerase n=1 Tax=Burkholderia cepacia GG4 TaxID=1009846 RepID=A0A9W3PC14_BURCE|nr:enoyl-CoA hydratase/isomerase family protein [Burkholderia cepacia]AFQ51111.1 Enoyl-CoA hydratase/isomerase [Burkholderia cepacia GG4]